MGKDPKTSVLMVSAGLMMSRPLCRRWRLLPTRDCQNPTEICSPSLRARIILRAGPGKPVVVDNPKGWASGQQNEDTHRRSAAALLTRLRDFVVSQNE